MQRHLGRDAWQRLHEEVGGTHPGLDRAEGMLDRFAPLAHLLWLSKPPLLLYFGAEREFGGKTDEEEMKARTANTAPKRLALNAARLPLEIRVSHAELAIGRRWRSRAFLTVRRKN